MDELGNAEARVWVSAVKAMVPIRTCAIVDEAIQMHGATGVSQWTPLARMYASQRTLRLAGAGTRCTGSSGRSCRDRALGARGGVSTRRPPTTTI